MRPLHVIAQDIRNDWKKPFFGAVPYIEAMRSLSSVSDDYGYDSGYSIVNYFLANATSWRGDVARSIKKELKDMVKR